MLPVNNKKKSSRACLSICLAVSGLLLQGCKDSSANINEPRLVAVETEFYSLPVYPGSAELHTTRMFNGVVASFGKKYRSEDSYSDVRKFYVEELEARSWQLKTEEEQKDWDGSFLANELIFTQDDLEVYLEYRGDKSKSGWDYALNVRWERRAK